MLKRRKRGGREREEKVAERRKKQGEPRKNLCFKKEWANANGSIRDLSEGGVGSQKRKGKRPRSRKSRGQEKIIEGRSPLLILEKEG